MQKSNKKAQMLGGAGVLFSLVLGLIFATILFMSVLIPQTMHYIHNLSGLDSGSQAVVNLIPMIEVFLLIGIYVGGGYAGYASVNDSKKKK